MTIETFHSCGKHNNNKYDVRDASRLARNRQKVSRNSSRSTDRIRLYISLKFLVRTYIKSFYIHKLYEVYNVVCTIVLYRYNTYMYICSVTIYL